MTDPAEADRDERRRLQDYPARMIDSRPPAVKILSDRQNDKKVVYVFQSPVTEDIAPEYFDTVTQTMDFQTIEKRLRRFPDYDKRPDFFAADIDLMVENGTMLNGPERSSGSNHPPEGWLPERFGRSSGFGERA
jgi:histone acetyltransferase